MAVITFPVSYIRRWGYLYFYFWKLTKPRHRQIICIYSAQVWLCIKIAFPSSLNVSVGRLGVIGDTLLSYKP